MITTKDKILEATAQIIERDLSYDQISMSAIAEKVGIGKSTIYEYFNSRESLLLATTYSLFEEYLSNVISFDLNNLSFEEAFEKQVNLIIKEGSKKQLVIRFLMQSQPSLINKNEELCNYASSFCGRVYNRFKEIFILGIKENKIKFKDYEIDKLMISGLISGCIYEHLNFNTITDEIFVKNLYQVVIKILN